MSAVHLSPIPDDRFGAWLVRVGAAYVEANVQAGEDADAVRSRSDSLLAQFFPEGQHGTDHLVREILDDGSPAGWVWVGPALPGAGVQWWLWDIYVEPDHRGRGVAAAAITAAEDLARQRGVTSIGLNVLGSNRTARALYERLGYGIHTSQMRKTLD